MRLELTLRSNTTLAVVRDDRDGKSEDRDLPKKVTMTRDPRNS
jgi:hypothetical protein